MTKARGTFWPAWRSAAALLPHFILAAAKCVCSTACVSNAVQSPAPPDAAKWPHLADLTSVLLAGLFNQTCQIAHALRQLIVHAEAPGCGLLDYDNHEGPSQLEGAAGMLNPEQQSVVDR